jgi:hypothetical protein
MAPEMWLTMMVDWDANYTKTQLVLNLTVLQNFLMPLNTLTTFCCETSSDVGLKKSAKKFSPVLMVVNDGLEIRAINYRVHLMNPKNCNNSWKCQLFVKTSELIVVEPSRDLTAFNNWKMTKSWIGKGFNMLLCSFIMFVNPRIQLHSINSL